METRLASRRRNHPRSPGAPEDPSGRGDHWYARRYGLDEPLGHEFSGTGMDMGSWILSSLVRHREDRMRQMSSPDLGARTAGETTGCHRVGTASRMEAKEDRRFHIVTCRPSVTYSLPGILNSLVSRMAISVNRPARAARSVFSVRSACTSRASWLESSSDVFRISSPRLLD